MIRLLADENFDNRILRGLRRAEISVDVVRVQETALSQADDPAVLEWAAQEGRIVLTHDVNTMPKYAHERVRAGQVMPGLVAVHLGAAIGEVIEDLLFLLFASEAEDFENQVVYLPLK